MIRHIGSLHKGWHIIILMVAIWACFGSVLGNGFVWDDTILVVGNPVYKEADFSRIFTGLSNNLEYQPLRDLSFVLDYRIWGDNPSGWHLTNLIIYSLLVLTIYLLVLRLLPLLASSDTATEESHSWAPSMALLTALLYALHPLNVQTVAFVTLRNSLLAALMAFLSALLFLCFMTTSGQKHRTSYVLSFICYLLSVLSKAIILPLPFLFAAIAVTRERGERKQYLIAVIPFLLLSAGSAVIFSTIARSSGMISENIIHFGGASLFVRLCIAVQIPFFYLGKFLFPAGLLPEYSINFARDPLSPMVLAAAAAIVLAVAVAVGAVRRFGVVSVAIVWFLWMLTPVLNLVPTHPIVADRYTLLPLFGLCLLFAYGLLRLSLRYQWIAVCCIVSVLLGTGLTTHSQALVWRTEESLWKDAVRKLPSYERWYQQLGMYYEERGDLLRAREQYSELARINRHSVLPRLFEANSAFRLGNYQVAAELYSQFMSADIPPRSSLNLAQSYEALGQFDKAARQYVTLLKPGWPDPQGKIRRQALERLKLMRQRFATELALLQKEAAARNDWMDRFKYAVRLDTLGLNNEAVAEYLQIANSGKGGWQVWFNLGSLYNRMGKQHDAVTAYEKSLALNPEGLDTWNNLGSVLRSQGDIRRAADCFKKASDLAPTFAYAQFNLANALVMMGKRDAAMAQIRLVKQRFPALAASVDRLETALTRESR